MLSRKCFICCFPQKYEHSFSQFFDTLLDLGHILATQLLFGFARRKSEVLPAVVLGREGRQCRVEVVLLAVGIPSTARLWLGEDIGTRLHVLSEKPLAVDPPLEIQYAAPREHHVMRNPHVCSWLESIDGVDQLCS